MGKRVSDLFAKNGEITKMVSNDSSLKSSDTNSVSPLINKSQIPNRVDASGAQVEAKVDSEDPIKIATNIIQKYQSITSSPASVMRILTGDFKIDAKKAAEVIKLPEFARGDIASNGLLSHMFGPTGGLIAGYLESMGIDETSLASNIMRTGAWIGGRYTLPMDMHPLDVLNLIYSIASMGLLGDDIANNLGNGANHKALRPRWSILAPLANSPYALKAFMSKTEESERFKIGWRIPDDINQSLNSNGGVTNSRLRTIKTEPSESKLGSLGSAIQNITNAISGNKTSTDIGNPAESTIYGNFKIGSSAIKDYASWEDYPYDINSDFGTDQPSTSSFDQQLNSLDIFSNRVNNLRDAGLLAGYADWAGFEIGSDHQWKIELYPYVSEAHGGGTCTPELPVFFVPNIWRFDKKDPRLVSDTSVRIKNGTEVKDVIAKEYPGSKDDGKYDYIAYSYSTCLPALSYDLSLGTVKTDSLKLFNGSTVEIFAGMNYNSILNISILDDVYGSMHKYMFQYINACYDINTHSLAPYYNCAFEIILKILRPGGKIKEAHHFIGVPVEYTPRLEGQQDPNESRLDITFGIIGYITPTNSKAWTDHDGREAGFEGQIPKTPTWKDIAFKAGQQFKDDKDDKSK